ncbi:hypothetical protein [Yellowstone lake phycodnavirus 2]|uniref:hypothetical protein n=1 Tax=Yellowstone lake phycodnavirus 2 TaxID=1586714 RepID=UPI0006EBE049|nr:hypothetical protein AR678_gp020 [Yellowstone lake phycodnavirus 2]BAT22294.1 hypothetical protein [Yellowstone lake phycodnavirus 2]
MILFRISRHKSLQNLFRWRIQKMTKKINFLTKSSTRSSFRRRSMNPRRRIFFPAV